MIDPNSTIPMHHEVRVTMRGVRLSENGSPVQVNTRSDFVAPELSPVQTWLQIGISTRGWTDTDVAIDTAVNGGRIQGRAAAELSGLSVGETVVRRTVKATTLRKLNNNGPAHRRMF